MTMPRLLLVSLLAAAALAACQRDRNWRVDRVDPEETIDLDYRFDDEDARATYRKMVEDCLARPWIDRFTATHAGQAPFIVLGTVRNQTQDYIDTENFTTQIQEELINSGRVRVKAQKQLRDELRDERLDTQYNDPATLKAVAREINADFIMLGRIGDIKERSADGRTLVSYYQINMELIDLETGEKVWIDTKEIKKLATR